MAKYCMLIGALLLALLGSGALWLVDVAMIRAGNLMCNGFFCLAADQAFHVALYVGLAAMWGLYLAVLLLTISRKR